MNLARALLTPWMATGKARRWVAGVIYTGSVIGVPVWMLLVGHEHDWMVLRVLAIGLMLASMIFLSGGAVSARVARQSRWPGVAHGAALGTWMYAAVGVAVPGAIVAGLRPDLAALTVALGALGASMGLVYMLSNKNYRSSGILIFILLLNPGLELSHSYATPWFAAAVAGIALTTTGLAVWVWRRMTVSEHWACPLTMSASTCTTRRTTTRQRNWSVWNAVVDALFRPCAQLRAALKAKVDIHRTGPRWPVRSIRIALGGALLPMSSGARVAMALWLLIALGAVAIFIIPASHYLSAGQAHSLNHAVTNIAIVLAATTCMISAIRVFGAHQHRDTNMVVLALLPGLGSPAQMRHHLLWAMLVLPLGINVAMWLGVLVLAGWQQAGWGVDLLMSLLVMGCISTAIGYVLRVAAGLRLTRVKASLGLVFMLLAISSISMLPGASRNEYAAMMLWLMCALWLAYSLAMLVVARRGWRRLRMLPHPFLTHMTSV